MAVGCRFGGRQIKYAVDLFVVFCFKQKTAYEMRISDWSSDVCSSDLEPVFGCLAVLLDLRPILRHQNDTAGRQFLSLAALDRQKQGARHHVDDLQLGGSRNRQR